MRKIFFGKFLSVGLCAAIMVQMGGMTAYADMQNAAVGTILGSSVLVSNVQETAVQNIALENITAENAVVAETAANAEVVENVAAANAALVENVAVQGPSSQKEDSGSSDKRNVIISGGSGSGMGVKTMGELNTTVQPMLGGATFTMLNSQSESQMFSGLIQTNNGSLIVIDGGLGADADYLTSQIAARGGHVAAWLITHPHGDHAGALYSILQNEDARYAAGQPANVIIDKIYYNFKDLNWYLMNDPDECTMAQAMIGTLSGRSQDMLQQVHRGDTFQIDTATIQVLNDPYEVSSDKGNNSGIVYKVTVNGTSILFLGDLSQAGGNRLLEDVGAPALKADIVQMSHHGQNGVSEKFYQAVGPTVCVWPTPRWLWVSMESKYAIQQTKSWMKDLGVQYHYVMKDGDQTIQ